MEPGTVQIPDTFSVEGSYVGLVCFNRICHFTRKLGKVPVEVNKRSGHSKASVITAITVVVMGESLVTFICMAAGKLPGLISLRVTTH